MSSAPQSSPVPASSGWWSELGALGAQCVFFLAGMVVSIMIGMFFGKILHGPGGLLIATLIAGAGLLAAAAFSQTLHDWLIQRSLDKSE